MASDFGLSGQPNQASLPFPRSAWSQAGLSQSKPPHMEPKMLQPPSLIGALLNMRCTTVPQSSDT